MSSKFTPMLLILVLGLVNPAFATEEQQTTRSAGKRHADASIELSRQLEQMEPLVHDRSGSTAARPAATGQAGVANRHDQLFEIYQAELHLMADLDGDGYHHAINLIFDADVSVDSATVYAKLYLSREGGPWSQYFTTDLFTIHGDDPEDAYEVQSELLEGYPPGYYSVLIELYSLDHAFMVASDVLDYHRLGRDIMIEDLARDEPYTEPYEEPYEESRTAYYEEEVYYTESGGGSMITLLLVFLIIQVVIAARGSLALFPRDEVIRTKK